MIAKVGRLPVFKAASPGKSIAVSINATEVSWSVLLARHGRESNSFDIRNYAGLSISTFLLSKINNLSVILDRFMLERWTGTAIPFAIKGQEHGLMLSEI